MSLWGGVGGRVRRGRRKGGEGGGVGRGGLRLLGRRVGVGAGGRGANGRHVAHVRGMVGKAIHLIQTVQPMTFNIVYLAM